jgi:hypothetical protein
MQQNARIKIYTNNSSANTKNMTTILDVTKTGHFHFHANFTRNSRRGRGVFVGQNVWFAQYAKWHENRVKCGLSSCFYDKTILRQNTQMCKHEHVNTYFYNSTFDGGLQDIRVPGSFNKT